MTAIDPWLLALGVLCIVYAIVETLREELDYWRERRASKKAGIYRRTGRWPL
jgi:hypothetical protein